jgi:hypothetical protein
VDRVKQFAVILLMAVLFCLLACAPAAPAPTPTPQPTPTPIEVLATKPEHLAGTWWNPNAGFTGHFFAFQADGTFRSGHTLEWLQETEEIYGRFWFEDGVYYEQSRWCFPTGSYRVYLTVQGRSVLSFRFEEIDDSEPSCGGRRSDRTEYKYLRVD